MLIKQVYYLQFLRYYVIIVWSKTIENLSKVKNLNKLSCCPSKHFYSLFHSNSVPLLTVFISMSPFACWSNENNLFHNVCIVFLFRFLRVDQPEGFIFYVSSFFILFTYIFSKGIRCVQDTIFSTTHDMIKTWKRFLTCLASPIFSLIFLNQHIPHLTLLTLLQLD